MRTKPYEGRMEYGIVMLVWDGVIIQAKVNQAYCEMIG